MQMIYRENIQKTIAITPHNLTQPTDIVRSQTISGLLVILLPIVMVSAIVGYRKHQATVMQQHIHRLNQIWQLDSTEQLS